MPKAIAALLLLLLGTSMGSSNDQRREESIRLAQQALSRDLGVGLEEISVRDVVRADWRDSSLGCPQKGMRYAPVLASGYRVILEVAGHAHEVHVAGDQAVRCDGTPGGPGPPTVTSLETAAKLSRMARKDLSSRLKVAEEAISITFIRPTTWPDASLGCPQPGATYAQGAIRGFRIELRSGGKTHRYHTDMAMVWLCDDGHRQTEPE